MRHVVFDVVDCATVVDDCRRRYRVRGCPEGAVEINPHLEMCRAYAGMFAGKACPHDVWRTGQTEEVCRVEGAENVAVRQDLSASMTAKDTTATLFWASS